MDWDRPELAKTPANYVPLSPLSYLARAADMFGDRTAVVRGSQRFSYTEFDRRCRRLAGALRELGVRKGDTVAINAANTPALLEAHYAVPMLGAVLNPLNYRLDSTVLAFCLDHGEAKVLIADREFHATTAPAIEQAKSRPVVVDLADPETEGAPGYGGIEYEELLAAAEPVPRVAGPADEWEPICLLYTSGTTGNPKGVVYSHRGAYLAALGNAMTLKLDHDTRYLWTLPMFHCSGWTNTWSVTAALGTHVCLRKVDPKRIFELIAAEGVTHMCGAPIVLNMMAHAPAEIRKPFGQRCTVVTGGAAPPSAVIANMERLGFEVLHGYGLTETYGPATFCLPDRAWLDAPTTVRHERMARQGVAAAVVDGVQVADSQSTAPVSRDAAEMGEILIRGNTVMKGYLKNPKATAEAFAGGWFHSGDLGVCHADAYVEVKDRSKDIIISGGENISSLEVEEVLYRHPKIMEAAVVARADPTWGETPCAFVMVKPGIEDASADEIIAFCRANLARFKVPKHVVFGPLPKTSTGKIQKYVLRERTRSI